MENKSEAVYLANLILDKTRKRDTNPVVDLEAAADRLAELTVADPLTITWDELCKLLADWQEAHGQGWRSEQATHGFDVWSRHNGGGYKISNLGDLREFLTAEVSG